MLELRVLSLDRGPAVRDLESGAHSPWLPMLELGFHSLDWEPTVGGQQSGSLWYESIDSIWERILPLDWWPTVGAYSLGAYGLGPRLTRRGGGSDTPRCRRSSEFVHWTCDVFSNTKKTITRPVTCVRNIFELHASDRCRFRAHL